MKKLSPNSDVQSFDQILANESHQELFCTHFWVVTLLQKPFYLESGLFNQNTKSILDNANMLKSSCILKYKL